MRAYTARPEGAGKLPAVIVFQEIFGVNAHIRDITERVAAEGYAAIAPDYFWRVDPNVELVQYAEAWARKIQFNTLVETVREVAKQPHRHPMVTVAIRSDGSVESVTFVISSGVAQVDDAIRRIVQSHEHYQAFSPALAREYDVIEIRRTWHFDDAVRLH